MAYTHLRDAVIHKGRQLADISQRVHSRLKEKLSRANQISSAVPDDSHKVSLGMKVYCQPLFGRRKGDQCYEGPLKVVVLREHNIVSIQEITGAQRVRQRKLGKKVYNLHKEKTDKALSLYKVFADEMNEVSSVGCGNFVAVSGLKTVQSGDIICSSSTAAKKLKIFNCKNKDTFEKLLQGSWVPKPVFFCSVEPPSQFYQLALDKALLELSREDPSLKVTLNNETGQTILGGMGELHLEIIKDRLRTDYKIEVDMGPLQIVYREKPLNFVKEDHHFHSFIGSKEHNVNISLSLRPERSPEILHLDTSKEASENLAHVSPQTLTTIKYGVISGLSKGPLMSCEVTDSYIVLHNLTMSKRIPDSLLVAATAQCVNKMLKVTGTKLLEPIMEVSIAVEDLYLQSVLGDLTRRRANIINISSKYAIKEIVSEVPLAELRGYAKYLRTITSGSARLTMEFASYREVLPQVQEKIMDGLI
nr:ribosome-releasing factor 2, mitochondrial [Halyomorpha halys]